MKSTTSTKLFSAAACVLSAALLSTLSVSAQSAPSETNPSTPSGTMGNPNGTMGNPNGTMGNPNGSMGAPDGTMGNPNGTMGAPGGSMSAPSSPMNQLSAVDKQFMMKAAQSDMTEIMTSQLALKRSSNKDVRAYAQQMIQAHTDSTKKLKPLAQQKGVMLPKDPGSTNKALITQLTKLSGQKFDQAYMSGQVKAHAKTEADYKKELQQGQDQNVKAFASQVLPIVSGHLRMAQGMMAKR